MSQIPPDDTVFRDEALRLACGDQSEPSPELAEHLARHPAECERLEEDRAVIETVRAAIAPEPLPGRLVARIDRELDAVRVPRRPAWVRPLRLCSAAAAACFLAALMSPFEKAVRTQEPDFALDRSEAATIAAAFGAILWESPAEESVAYLSDRVKDVARCVERDPEAESSLPWGPEDDWDVPPGGESHESNARGCSRAVAVESPVVSLDAA
jgi:hypothetical protein